MTKIYYCIKQFVGDNFVGHKHENKWCVIILSPNDLGFCTNFSSNGEDIYSCFETEHEVRVFITQTLKPDYYECFGSGYELIELEHGSQEWSELFDKWKFTQKVVNGVIEAISIPRWKLCIKYYYETTKSFLKKLFA